MHYFPAGVTGFIVTLKLFNYAPILEGDSLYFKLVVSAASGQAAVVDSSTVTTPDRTYLIKINAVGANAWD